MSEIIMSICNTPQRPPNRVPFIGDHLIFSNKCEEIILEDIPGELRASCSLAEIHFGFYQKISTENHHKLRQTQQPKSIPHFQKHARQTREKGQIKFGNINN